MTLVVVHLCVREDRRGQGIAHRLIDDLCDRASGFAGLQANCRTDFPANAAWPRLGFTTRHEIPGRSVRKETTLSVWWRPLGLPDLFSSAPSERLTAALDINVLVDLQARSPTPQQEESRALLANWVEEAVELVVTDEVFAEIARNPRADERRRRQVYASGFRELPGATSIQVQELVHELEDVLGAGLSEREVSDRRHLAKSALGGADFFVTRDTELLGAAPAVEAMWGMSIVRPCDLIARSDVELEETTFAPRRLSGSSLSLRRLLPADEEKLPRLFQALAKGERKGDFIGRLRTALAYPDRHTAIVIEDDEANALGLLVVESGSHETKIVLVRTSRHAISDVLARHLVWLAVCEGVREGRTFTRIVDAHPPEAARAIMGYLGFRDSPSGKLKVNGLAVHKTKELADELRALSHEETGWRWLPGMIDLLDGEASSIPPRLTMELERAFWPAKLLDTGLPSYIVPIKAEWAAQLFHERLAEQSLFGAQPSLMLRLENAYYRSARPRRVEAPARLLWYVTASKERPESKCFVAVSLADEVVRGPAKEVFGRFKRYGVYGWHDVEALAGGEGDQPIAAFRFGHTEVFPVPVPLAQARELAADAGASSLFLQSPSRIASDVFEAIYSQGLRRSR